MRGERAEMLAKSASSVLLKLVMVGAISSSFQTALRASNRPQAVCIGLFSGKRRVLARLVFL